MAEQKTQGISSPKKDFDKWYPELIVKSQLAEYSAVSGCMVIRPYGYALWENFVKVIDKNLKKLGVENTYFPMLIPESLLNKEKEHIKGFSPEVAWVTETGDSKVDEKLAIRPTSESIMYPSFSKWINSWRDLPMKLNQWNNVIRWEFKHPKLFLRTREFLWNEGHSVFETREEAEQEVKELIDMYHSFTKNYLALYGEVCRKTEKEKFAGAEYTITIELMMPDKRMIQGPDVHHDGQKFAEAFDIKFLDKNEKSNFVWQNTYALTTRMIGILAAVHGDDKGLVLPPKIAPVQAVIVPIYYNDEDKKKVFVLADEISTVLSSYSVKFDSRDEYSPGWKFNEWEMKGVPIRIEIGPKDIAAGKVTIVRRDTGEKSQVDIAKTREFVEELMADIHKHLYEKSRKFTEENTLQVSTITELEKAGESGRGLAPFCGEILCEEEIRNATGLKSSGIKPEKPPEGNCVMCGKKASHWTYFAKSY